MKLSFHGSVRGVTGSCFLLETSKAKLLIDCGMFQGERINAPENLDELGFDPATIDAVVVTHAHYDHTGRIPLLMKKGFQGNVYLTPPTKALSAIVLEDAQHVMAENAQRNGDDVLFDLEDVKAMEAVSKGVNYHTQLEAAPGLSVMFHDAGHILGSAFITVDVPASESKDQKARRFLFSGDIGNDQVPILPDTEAISRADVIVCESTYGNRDHEPTADRKRKLIEVATKVLNRGGTLMIPSFSIERTQELLYELDQLVDESLIPSVPMYLDSPLAIKATEIYRHFKQYLLFDRPILESPDRDFFSFPRLKETLRVDASKAINDDPGPKIIIAGSGMMTGGRILHHLKRHLSDPKNGLLIIGYQAHGTLGRKIFEGAEVVKIHREEVPVKAEVVAIGSFSAHADRNKLRSWLQPEGGPAEKIFLVHGDEDVKPEFKTFLEEEISSEIIIPQYWQSFEW